MKEGANVQRDALNKTVPVLCVKSVSCVKEVTVYM